MEKLILNKLGEFKKRGSEVLVKVCPHCGNDKYKFSINTVKGVYKCWRGSCGATGHVSSLFPNEAITLKPIRRHVAAEVKKIRKITPESVNPLPEKNVGWTKILEERGISRETAARLKMLVDVKTGALFIPLQDKEGEICGVKYRTQDKKIWAESGSKLVLFNYLGVKDKKSLIITEGEIDCLTVAELGIDNVCSIPSGTKNMDWIEHHWEFLNSMESITLAFDNDEAGNIAFIEVSKRLGYNKIKSINLGIHKDINDFLLEEGSIDTYKMLLDAQLMEIPNVKEGSKIKADNGNDTAISYGCKVMDGLMAGHRYKEVTVYSGTPGSGKSTLVNNLTCNFIDAGEKVFVYSGEFKADKYKRWLLNTICDPDKLTRRINRFTHIEEAYCPNDEELDINKWMEDKLYIYDSDSTAKEKELLDIMLEVRNRHGVKIFVLDNLMTINLEGEENNKWDNQKYFLQKLHDFTVKHDVAVHLVAHPKKMEKHKLAEYTMYDISGSSDIPNLVDNIIFLKRLSEEEMYNIQEKSGISATVGAILCKDRENGRIGELGLWQYNPISRRFLDPQNKEKNYDYKNVQSEGFYEPFPE